MQNWTRLYSYITEYQHLVYDYYSKHAVAFLTNYYNIDKDTTVWDDQDLHGGAYERTGEYSGMKFNKYLLLPVYFSEEMNVTISGEEIGLEKQGLETTFVIPGTYGITPYPGDYVKFEQSFLNQNQDNYPTYIITNVDIGPNTQMRYWKIKCEVNQSENVELLEAQLSKIYVFFDYDKKIYTLEDATTMAKMLHKNAELKTRIERLWDPNSGFFQI